MAHSPRTLALLILVAVRPALAVATSISVSPTGPTSCDSVRVTVNGYLPNSCYRLIDARIRFLPPPPCMSPEPCPGTFQVTLTETGPEPRDICLQVTTPYTRTFALGRLPPGPYNLEAREQVVVFGPDSSQTVVGATRATGTFAVRYDSTCALPEGCYILDFHEPRVDPPRDGCDATAPPGGEACIPVSLVSSSPVAGLQTTVTATRADGASADGLLHATSVTTTDRASGFQVGWSAEGSTTKILLYSTTWATLGPGEGPVVRICYSVAPETVPQTFTIEDTGTIVANPRGEPLTLCPTFARVAPGSLCVRARPCDVNGDGVADVLDIVRMVNCVLAGPSDPCPDSFRAVADCNGDGSLDVRDVICCVRRIVGLTTPPQPVLPPAVGTPSANTIEFEGPVAWTGATEGEAMVRLNAAADWGGAQFSIDPQGSSVRISGMELDEASGLPGVQVVSDVDASGVAHGILFSTSAGPRPAGSALVRVHLVRSGAGSGASLRLVGLKAGSASGLAAGISSSAPVLDLTSAPVGAPALFRARPNPFTARTEIGFALPAEAAATLDVFDVHGRLVRRLAQGVLPAGTYRMPWNGENDRGRAAGTGIYFAKLTVGGTTRTERILLLR